MVTEDYRNTGEKTFMQHDFLRIFAIGLSLNQNNIRHRRVSRIIGLLNTADDHLLLTQGFRPNCDDIEALFILESSKNEIDHKICSAFTKWMQPFKESINYNQIGLIQVPKRFEKFVERIRELSAQDTPPKRLKERLFKHTDRVKHSYKGVRIRGWFRCNRTVVVAIKANGFCVINQPYHDHSSSGFHFTSSPRSTERIFPLDECLIMCYILLRDPTPLLLMNYETNENECQYCFCAHKNPFRFEQFDSCPVEEVEEGLWDEFFTNDPNDILPTTVVLTDESFSSDRFD